MMFRNLLKGWRFRPPVRFLSSNLVQELSNKEHSLSQLSQKIKELDTASLKNSAKMLGRNFRLRKLIVKSLLERAETSTGKDLGLVIQTCSLLEEKDQGVWHQLGVKFLKEDFSSNYSDALLHLLKNWKAATRYSESILERIQNSKLKNQDYVTIFWGCSGLGLNPVQEHILKLLPNIVKDLNCAQFALTLLTLHKMKHYDKALLKLFAENLPENPIAQEVVMISQTFLYSKLYFKEVRDFIQKHSLENLDSFKPRDICNLINPLLVNEAYSSPELIDKIYNHCLENPEITKKPMDFSTISHFFKKNKRDLWSFEKRINKEMLEKSTPEEVAVICFSFADCLSESSKALLKEEILKKHQGMHAKSILNLAFIWSGGEIFDPEFWKKFYPIYDSKIQELVVSKNRHTIKTQISSIETRILRFKLKGLI